MRPHTDEIRVASFADLDTTTLYAILRPAHTVLAYLLFLMFLAHLGAALTHALVFRDGVFRSMVK